MPGSPLVQSLGGTQKFRPALKGECNWVQYFLDDFDAPEILQEEKARRLAYSMSPTQLAQRRAYSRSGVMISEEKASVRVPRVERMGALVDGEWGRVGVPIDKIVLAICFTLWLLGKGLVKVRTLLMVLGRLVCIFEFRRPLLGVLNAVWTCGGGSTDKLEVLTNYMISELLVSCCLSPLAFSDLRTSIDGLVTCSDASMSGGGACASSGISEAADRFLNSDDHDSFRSLGAMRSSEEWPLKDLDASCHCYLALLSGLHPPHYRPRVLVVGLFDGIAGLLVAVTRLPVLVIGFVTSEIDSAARRLVRKRWPGVIELGSITAITPDQINRLAGTFSAAVDLVIIGAGSPCQDLSGLLAGGLGLEGPRSKLFFEIPRVVSLFKEAFQCAVHYFVENVFSMTPEN